MRRDEVIANITRVAGLGMLLTITSIIPAAIAAAVNGTERLPAQAKSARRCFWLAAMRAELPRPWHNRVCFTWRIRNDFSKASVASLGTPLGVGRRPAQYKMKNRPHTPRRVGVLGVRDRFAEFLASLLVGEKCPACG